MTSLASRPLVGLGDRLGVLLGHLLGRERRGQGLLQQAETLGAVLHRGHEPGLLVAQLARRLQLLGAVLDVALLGLQRAHRVDQPGLGLVGVVQRVVELSADVFDCSTTTLTLPT